MNNMKPIAWYDPSNGAVGTDRDSPLFTALGQIWPLYVRGDEEVVGECIQELKTSMKGDPYTGNLFDCEYNTCINEQIAILKDRFGIQ